jgi:hypothetical protein
MCRPIITVTLNLEVTSNQRISLVTELLPQLAVGVDFS